MVTLAGMTPTAKRHMKAILSGKVEKTNVIGLRKAFNHQARIDYGLSGNRCNVTGDEVQALENALATQKPVVKGELHDSGVKLLRNRRYKNRWSEFQAEVIANLDHFRLIGFDWIDNFHSVPVYKAVARDGRAFKFRNIAWQAGGDGPETLA